MLTQLHSTHPDMIIRLHDFLNGLHQFSYVTYALYARESILFITLYDEDEVQKFIICEAVSSQEFRGISASLEMHKSRMALSWQSDQ